MMLQIVVEAAGTVCDADCSIYSQAVDRQRPPTADRSLADFRQAKKMHIFNTGMSLPSCGPPEAKCLRPVRLSVCAYMRVWYSPTGSPSTSSF